MRNEPKELVNAIQNILVQEKTGDKEEYQKFFQSALKKFGVKSPAELKGDKEKEFYDYVDKNWEGDNEKKESVELEEKKMTVTIDHEGGFDANARKAGVKLKPVSGSDWPMATVTGEKKKLQQYLTLHYDDTMDEPEMAQEMHPEIFESVELEEKKMTVNIDHDGSNDPNAKKLGIKLKKTKHTDFSFDATGDQKKLQQYLALHYDSQEDAEELHPEIFESVELDKDITESVSGNRQAALVLKSINQLTVSLRPGSSLQKDLEKLAGRKLQKEFKDLQKQVDELAYAFEDLEMEINMGESTQKESVELEEASRSKQIKDLQTAQKLLRKVDKEHGQPLFFDKSGDQVDINDVLQAAINYYKDPDSDIDESVEPTISIGEMQFTVEEFGKLLDEPITEEKTKAESYLDWYKKYDPMKDPDMKDMLADIKKKHDSKIAARVTKLVKDNKLFPDALSDAIHYGGLISYLKDGEMSDSDALKQAFADV